MLFASHFFVQPFSPPAANGMCIPVPKDVTKEAYRDLNASLNYRTFERILGAPRYIRAAQKACSAEFSPEPAEKEPSW